MIKTIAKFAGLVLAIAAGLAPLPATAHPEGQPRQQFVIYFTAQSAGLEPIAREIITYALEQAKEPRVYLVAHTDTRGDAYPNLLLSAAMAQTVAQELIRQGVAPDRITIEVVGEAKPAVATADNVSEPQNRRVEVFLF